MLKIRIMPTLLYKDVGLVKGVGFDSSRPVGAALQAVRVNNMREVDELVFLDISATQNGRGPDFELVDDLADECFMPLTVGGGVKSIQDIQKLLSVGADKVAINSAALAQPEIIREASDYYGSQCITVSIDAKRLDDGTWEVFTHCGTLASGRDPVSWAKEVEALGAGEILLTSIDQDGVMEGYDIELTKSVTQAVSIPVIASGGCGNYAHMADVLRLGNVTAVAAASIFHFTEQTPREAKLYLKKLNFPVRV